MLAIYKYLAESDIDDKDLNLIIKDDLKMSPKEILEYFVIFSGKYRELFEFPNGVMQIMTFFQTEMEYDLPLLKLLCETFTNCINQIVAKNEF